LLDHKVLWVIREIQELLELKAIGEIMDSLDSAEALDSKEILDLKVCVVIPVPRDFQVSPEQLETKEQRVPLVILDLRVQSDP